MVKLVDVISANLFWRLKWGNQGGVSSHDDYTRRPCTHAFRNLTTVSPQIVRLTRDASCLCLIHESPRGRETLSPVLLPSPFQEPDVVRISIESILRTMGCALNPVPDNVLTILGHPADSYNSQC